MGVTNLWKILDDMGLGEEKDFNFLSGKRVAVDLSGWVVQAKLCPGLNKCKNPHLRNLFFRVSRLLKNGIFPIFILEGKVPDLKEAVFKKRNNHGDCNRSRFDSVLKECADFLESLGVPYIKSSGEAEALCAFLYTKKIVDAVITEDGDAFLYGADTVLRDFSSKKNNPYVKQYSLKSAKNTLSLDQPKLIALALLLGCDYDKEGVPGIGQETAVKLLTELQGKDLIERFKQWKEHSESELFPGYDPTIKKQGFHCKQCSHLGNLLNHKDSGCIMCKSETGCLSDGKNPCSCTWHKTQEINCKQKAELKVYQAAKKLLDFPNLKIVEEFKNYTDSIPDPNKLELQCPNLKEFKIKAYTYLSWSYEDSHEHVFPLVTSWLVSQLCKEPTMCKETFLFKPIKIIKQRTKNHIKCFEVEWNHNGENTSDFAAVNMVTFEYEEQFKMAYPDLFTEFYDSVIKPKHEAKSPKRKLVKPKEKTKKVIHKVPVDSPPILLPVEHNLQDMFDSLFYDSSDSFSDIPLSQRIQMISKYSEKNRLQSSVRNIACTPAKSSMLSDCKVTSPISILHCTNEKNPCPPIFNGVSLLYDEVENLTEKMKDLKTDELDSILCSPCIDLESKYDKPLLCLEFSDSDDSCGDVLQSDFKVFYNLSYDSFKKTSVLVNNTQSSFEDNLSNINDYLKNHSTFLNATTYSQHKDSKLIYSLRESSPGSFTYRNSPAKDYNSYCNSTPKNNLRKSLLNKMLNLSTHKASPLNHYSLQMYSPVIFDSSFEDSICLN